MSQLALRHYELIEAARAILRVRFKQGYHEVGAALRTKSGRVFSAVHVEAYVGRIAVCAEGIAIGMAAAAGDTDIESIVAVDRHGNAASPCGMCRELISDYAPEALVIVSSEADGQPVAVKVGELLPSKYRRRD
jgi:cytidine deaminase